jgi:hypothetical protein
MGNLKSCFMKNSTSRKSLGQAHSVLRTCCYVAITAVLISVVNRVSGVSVATIGGGPDYYANNGGAYFGYTNSIFGTVYSQFHTPSGIALNSAGNYLYVADRDNNEIREIDLVGGYTYTFATNLISRPVGVAVDNSGNVYVLNQGSTNSAGIATNGSVLEFDNYGDLLATNTGSTLLTNAAGIALDVAGNIYVTVSSNKLIEITGTTITNLATIAIAGTSLQGVVVKRSGLNAGLIAACDSGRNGIYLINPSTGTITTNAGFNGAGDGTGLNNQGVPNSIAKFFQPSGLAETGDGSLIVSDYGNNRVKVVTASGITTNLYGVASNYWSTSFPGWVDGTVTLPEATNGVAARLPFGVAFAPDGSIYTTEDYYHTIRHVTGAGLVLPPPTKPAAPTNLTITTNSTGGIVLAWLPSSGATNYNIGRSLSSGGSYTIIGTTTSTTFTDTNVVANTTYYYVVTASNAGGTSSASQQTSIVSPIPPSNTISFGFASGPGSSQFVASPGQTFEVPVGLSLLSGAPQIYGLQFNVTLTNLGSTVVNPQTISFTSLLGKPDTNNDGYYQSIPPIEFISTNPPSNVSNPIPYQGGWYQNLQFANTNNEDLLGIGWLEVYGRTNLYNTLGQNLLTYPIVDGTDGGDTASQMVIGAYGFGIPSNAVAGDVYQIQIGRPSATTFSGLSVNPYGSPVSFYAPANTNLIGPGSVNALKNVTIGQIKYLVGDVYPANWYNAGDFGSGNLVNIDVIRVFDFAAYPIAKPPTASDLFNALDSSGNLGVLDSATGYYTNAYVSGVSGYPYFTNLTYSIVNNTIFENTNGIALSTNPTPAGVFTSPNLPVYLSTDFVTINEEYTNTYIMTNADLTITTNVVPVNNFVNVSIQPGVSTLFNGNDTTINQIAFGDGVLDVCDVYVTYRRSLDSSLVWYQRFWTNGQLAAIRVPNVVGQAVVKSAVTSSTQPKAQTASTAPPQVHFTAGDITNCSSGQVVQIPITATIYGSYPLRVLMLNLTVEPLDGSPALTTPVQFTQTATVLGTPYTTDSAGNGNYSAVWLNSANAGLTGTVTIGTLSVTIPAGVSANSAYAVHFDHASASPNGLASFPKQTLTGIITMTTRTNSSYGDGIPDAWRLRWFGTVNNYLSLSNACPTGDGINNWMKYVAGVDPNVANDFPSTNPIKPVPSGSNSSIHWPTVSGIQYVIQRSGSLFAGTWSNIATNTGTGTDMEFDDSSAGQTKFYRVLILH